MPPVPPPVPPGLRAWFREAQEVGILGPAPIDEHAAHADRYRRALGENLTVRALDLGTGAGVPGLFLASWWPQSLWWLVDGKEKRVELLRRAVLELGWSDRIDVRGGRAEELAHDARAREQFDVVVARSFGPPAVVAECGAPFVRVGGRLAVSEPPRRPSGVDPAGEPTGSRWLGQPLGQLGLEVGSSTSSIQVLAKVAPTPERFPRRTGIPAKRPLF